MPTSAGPGPRLPRADRGEWTHSLDLPDPRQAATLTFGDSPGAAGPG